MSYEEVTFEEYVAITIGLYNNGATWRDYYWAGCPSWRQPVAWVRFHMDEQNRALRAMCRKHGGFDPFFPFAIKEFE
jgi:hypothetical protein